MNNVNRKVSMQPSMEQKYSNKTFSNIELTSKLVKQIKSCATSLTVDNFKILTNQINRSRGNMCQRKTDSIEG